MYDAPCDEDIFDGLNPITFLKCSPSRNALLLLLLLLLFFERDVENVRFPSLSFPNIVDDFIAGAPPASEKEEDKEEEEEEVEHEENNEDALLAQRVVFWRNLVMFLKQKIAAREKTEEREEEEEEEGRKSRSKEFNLRAAKKSEKRRKVNSRCRGRLYVERRDPLHT
jgi:hypothetical protein